MKQKAPQDVLELEFIFDFEDKIATAYFRKNFTFLPLKT